MILTGVLWSHFFVGILCRGGCIGKMDVWAIM